MDRGLSHSLGRIPARRRERSGCELLPLRALASRFRRPGPGAAARAGERDVRHPGRRDRHDQSLPLHPFDRRVHDGRVRDRGARPRHPPSGSSIPGARGAAHRDPHAPVRRPRIDQGLERRELGSLWRHGSADDRAGLRPSRHGSGRHRRSLCRRGRVDHQSLPDRHRVFQARRLHRRRHRAATRPARPRPGGDGRLHALVRAAGEGRSAGVALRAARRGRGARDGGCGPAGTLDPTARGRHRARVLHLCAPRVLDRSLGRDPPAPRRSPSTRRRRSICRRGGSSAGGCRSFRPFSSSWRPWSGSSLGSAKRR